MPIELKAEDFLFGNGSHQHELALSLSSFEARVATGDFVSYP
jgi:hypothetical protein